MEYNIGDIVYLKTDSEQHDRVVTGIMLRPQDCYIYHVSRGAEETAHYSLEITTDKNWNK